MSRSSIEGVVNIAVANKISKIGKPPNFIVTNQRNFSSMILKKIHNLFVKAGALSKQNTKQYKSSVNVCVNREGKNLSFYFQTKTSSLFP